jgi:hypothetical protein
VKGILIGLKIRVSLVRFLVSAPVNLSGYRFFCSRFFLFCGIFFYRDDLKERVVKTVLTAGEEQPVADPALQAKMCLSEGSDV